MKEAMMHFDTVTYGRDGVVATIILNRPERMNAFTPQMGTDLIAALDLADDDDRVRAVILTGAGRAFCAGMDLVADGNVFGLDESIEPESPDMVRNRDTGGMVVLRLFRMKKPLIGAINGASVGVGTTMQLPLDVRIASPFAKFGFVFSKRGITLESCASWFLPRLVGMTKALEWSFSGKVFGPDEALAGGLISEIIPAEALLARAREIALGFTEGTSALSVALNRQLLWRMMGASHPMEAHKAETRTMFAMSMADGKEGVQAFLGKREPVFAAKISDGAPKGFDWNAEPSFE